MASSLLENSSGFYRESAPDEKCGGSQWLPPGGFAKSGRLLSGATSLQRQLRSAMRAISQAGLDASPAIRASRLHRRSAVWTEHELRGHCRRTLRAGLRHRIAQDEVKDDPDAVGH